MTSDDIEELITHRPQEQSTEEMMEKDNMDAEQQQSAEEPPEEQSTPVKTLSSWLATCESLAEEADQFSFSKRLEILATLKSMTNLLGKILNARVNEGLQAFIIHYLKRP